MNKLAKDCIERIYGRKDYEYFRQKSKQVPTYLNALIELTYPVCKMVNTYNAEDDPTIELCFDFDGYTEAEFCVEYKTLLRISKVANLFVFQHEFCVENRDPSRMTPVLDGFSEESYIFLQSKLEREVTEFLEKQNLHKLQLSELNEVITNLEIPNKSIFGKQMTLENALFRDLYDICEM